MRATQYPLRWFSFLCWILLASVCFLLTVAQPGSAQVDQGAITGLVTDSSGAVVGNAGVTLTNLDNGLVLQTTTTSTGEYTFSPVRIGNYSVSATSQGFATTTQKDLKLNVQQRLVVNLQLKPGSTSERIEVSAVAPLMQTEDASVGQVIGSHQIENHSPEWPELHIPGAARRRRELSPGGHPRQRGHRRFRGQWQPSGAEQLHAGWHRQQL